MSEKIESDTQLVGAAGEHLVLSRLLARGILAAQAPRGTRKADILCLKEQKGHQYLSSSFIIEISPPGGKKSGRSKVLSGR